METEDWSHHAVQELEELGRERKALEEGQACAADRDDKGRISAINTEIDALYARLNQEAEHIASTGGADEPADHTGEAAPRESEPAQLASKGGDSIVLVDPVEQSVESLDASADAQTQAPQSIDTVVVEHPAGVPPPAPANEAAKEDPEAWLEDERLELRAELERLRANKEQSDEACDEASKRVDGQSQEFDRVRSQALAAKAALERFEKAKLEMESQLAQAREQLKAQREKERRARVALAAMEARVRAESKLLQNLDLVRTRIESVEAALASTTASAEKEKAALTQSVEDALVSAERATRQAEEMRDAAERAHQRAQQAIAHAQEVETRSDVREQELDRIIDGLEGQIVGLSHEQSGILQQLDELRDAKRDKAGGRGLTLIVEEDSDASALDATVILKD